MEYPSTLITGGAVLYHTVSQVNDVEKRKPAILVYGSYLGQNLGLKCLLLKQRIFESSLLKGFLLRFTSPRLGHQCELRKAKPGGSIAQRLRIQILEVQRSGPTSD